MSINWYPGHMVTARTKAAETMRKTDLDLNALGDQMRSRKQQLTGDEDKEAAA